MRRSHRNGVTYDPRTGHKVKGHKLREDGERRGLYTTWPDEENPQKHVRPPPPDGQGWRQGAPDAHGIGATIHLGAGVTADGLKAVPLPSLALSVGSVEVIG